MDLNAFVDALNAPAHIRENPEWMDNVFTSLDVSTAAEKALFEEYLAVTVANSQPGVPIDTEAFYNDWQSFQLNGSTGGSTDIATYKEIFATFFPDKKNDFFTEFSDFLFRALRDTGEISPADMVSAWFGHMTYFFFFDPRSVFVSGLEANNADRVAIMLRVYRIVIDILETTQKLAIAQANRLDFYGAYQEAYTDQMSEVPQFLPGVPVSTEFADFDFSGNLPDTTIATRTVFVPQETLLPSGGYDLSLLDGRSNQYHPINRTDFNPAGKEGDRWFVDENGNRVKETNAIRKLKEGAQEYRADTAVVSSKVTESLRSYRSGVVGEAQLHQTIMGQTNQSVNQQTDVGTALMKTLSNLIQSVFQ
jgi:hypothetical protein